MKHPFHTDNLLVLRRKSSTINEMLSLLAEFAKRGDNIALAAMRQRFETIDILYDSSFGYHKLFEVDGINALIRLLGKFGQKLQVILKRVLAITKFLLQKKSPEKKSLSQLPEKRWMI